MSTAVLDAPRRSSAPVPDAVANRMLLSGISWETYCRLRDELDREGSHVFLTYEQGQLEIEMPDNLHEWVRGFVSRLLDSYLSEFDIHYFPSGQTTWRHEWKKRGLEADESYYLTNARSVVETDIDITRDPPPDLAIEVEVTAPLLPKLRVYAGLGVPEIWHIYGDGRVRILRLDEAKTSYTDVGVSQEVPYFTAQLLQTWIERRRVTTHADTLREFRQTLRQQRREQ
jgi:Uma2 family endonuclease